MARISRGILGVLAGFGISVVSFGLLIKIGFSTVRSGGFFTPDDPLVGALTLIFYAGIFMTFGSIIYFWVLQPSKGAVAKLLKSEDTEKDKSG